MGCHRPRMTLHSTCSQVTHAAHWVLSMLPLQCSGKYSRIHILYCSSVLKFVASRKVQQGRFRPGSWLLCSPDAYSCCQGCIQLLPRLRMFAGVRPPSPVATATAAAQAALAARGAGGAIQLDSLCPGQLNAPGLVAD